jgi:LacI family transcriptional regulator
MTVVNGLKGRGNASETTRKRLLQCAEELKDRPKRLARSLIQGKASPLGFLLPTIVNPFYPEIAEAIERTAN